MPEPYAHFRRDQLTLTDELAIDRTELANERTLLAYIRTALGFLVLGLTFHHFLEQVVYHALGFTFMGFSAILFTFGVVRFLQVRRTLKIARSEAPAGKSEVPKSE